MALSCPRNWTLLAMAGSSSSSDRRRGGHLPHIVEELVETGRSTGNTPGPPGLPPLRLSGSGSVVRDISSECMGYRVETLQWASGKRLPRRGHEAVVDMSDNEYNE